jgi:hypothetical protein
MKYRLAAIVGIMFLIMSSAMACHWFCNGQQGSVPTQGGADIVAFVGQTINFQGSDPDTTVTYEWTVTDDYNQKYSPTTIGRNFAFTVPSSKLNGQGTVCNAGYTVEYTATKSHGDADSLNCIQTGCYKIFAKCQEVGCPTTPDWCFGKEPETKPTVTPPAYDPGFTYTWSYRSLPGGSWNSVGSGTTPSSMPWTTIVAGNYEMWMKQKFGDEVVKECSATNPDLFTVFPTPIGGANHNP